MSKLDDKTNEQIANVYEQINNEILALRNKQDLLRLCQRVSLGMTLRFML